MRLSRWSPGCGSPWAMSDSPRRLLSCVSKPGSQTPAPTPSQCVSTHARPCAVDRDHVRRVLAAVRLRSRARRRARAPAPSLGEPASAGTGEELRDAREPASRGYAPPPVYGTTTGSRQRGRYSARSSAVNTTPSTREERLRERAAIDARSALLGERLERLRRARAGRGESPASRVRPVAREELGAALERVEPAEHLERARVHRGQRNTGARQARAPARTSRFQGSRPSRSQSSPSAAGSPGTAHDAGPIAYTTSSSPKAIGSSASSPSPEGTAAKPSRFMHARAVEHDRVAPGEEAAHHRLGDARRERHRDDRVRRRAAVGEDLGPASAVAG